MQGYRDLRSYKLAFELAMDVFKLSGSFPQDERYSLTSQIRRSSRSVAANLAEGFRKRQYPQMFASKLADSDAEAADVQVWLDFALACGYVQPIHHQRLRAGYEQLGGMLGRMITMPERFAPAKRAAI
jgi:four helix bundle protein